MKLQNNNKINMNRKEGWNAIIHDPMQQKFAIILLVVLFALIAMQIDISRQIDTESLIRIHVLGNSDSDEDQAFKLIVKDAVVAYLAPQLEHSQSLDESRAIIQTQLPQIAQIANETLAQSGSTDTVTLQYGQFDFPIKYYGSFSLPAGNYEALRILIGEAQGRNWWCVLFPPLCFTDSNVESSSITTTTTESVDSINTDSISINASSGKYTGDIPDEKLVIKWRGKELFEKWIAK